VGARIKIGGISLFLNYWMVVMAVVVMHA